MQESSDLIYGLNDRPPLRGTLFAALQHLLAIFVAIITPPLIISSALKFDLETTGFLVSMSLFVSGLATFIQCHRIGPLGAGAALHTRNIVFLHLSDYRSRNARHGQRSHRRAHGP